MEISLSTFILELVNFLVLVWILKRFLYRPVLDIIDRRHSEIDETMAEARRIDSEAQALKQRYESRLSDWEKTKADAREALQQELDAERSKKLEALNQTLEQEREKNRAADTQRIADQQADIERRALVVAARFASRLLGSAATPQLQSRLVADLVGQLDALSRDKVARLLGNPDRPPERIRVLSAFPLTDEEKAAISERTKTFVDVDVPVTFDEDPALGAGVRITIGACVLGLNLEDELAGFARLSNGLD